MVRSSGSAAGELDECYARPHKGVWINVRIKEHFIQALEVFLQLRRGGETVGTSAN